MGKSLKEKIVICISFIIIAILIGSVFMLSGNIKKEKGNNLTSTITSTTNVEIDIDEPTTAQSTTVKTNGETLTVGTTKTSSTSTGTKSTSTSTSVKSNTKSSTTQAKDSSVNNQTTTKKKSYIITTTTGTRVPKTNKLASKTSTTKKNSTTTTKKITTVRTTTTTKVTTTATSKTNANNLVSYNGWLNIKNNTLVNQYGQKIQLRGMSTHGIQWYGDFATYSNMKILRDNWNSNLFRIAMYTNENGYIQNPSIKSKVIEIVNNAISLNMYVIIDWHILSDGNPQTYESQAISFFSEMSNKYKNYPNVIYEICNEPNGGVTWNNNIKPYAEKVISAIRANSPKSIIIVGTGTWSQDVDQAASNPINDSRVMYSLHFYAGTHKSWLRDRANQALTKIPLFVTEWGTTDASGNGNVDTSSSQEWITWMKNNNISWANWSLSNKNESSALLKSNVPNNTINDNYLTQSGVIVKNAMKG